MSLVVRLFGGYARRILTTQSGEHWLAVIESDPNGLFGTGETEAEALTALRTALDLEART